MRSDLEPTYAACYQIEGLNMQISRPVAATLVSAGRIDITQLKSNHTQPWKLNRDHSFKNIKHKRSFNGIRTNNIKIKRIQSDDKTSLSISEQDDIDNNSYQDIIKDDSLTLNKTSSFDDLHR
jgi:hypothetical protein